MAIEAVKRMAHEIHLYPSVDAIEFREELSKYYGFPVENIVVGAGMDGVIETLLRVFLDKGDESIIPLPTFSYYENVTNFNSASPVFVDRKKPGYGLDVDAIVAKAGKNTKFIFITSPNNPTGNVATEKEIERSPSPLTVSCSWMRHTRTSPMGRCWTWRKNTTRIVIGRTMSKAWGLAGLRIGYAFVPGWVYKDYMKAATPFSLDPYLDHRRHSGITRQGSL